MAWHEYGNGVGHANKGNTGLRYMLAACKNITHTQSSEKISLGYLARYIAVVCIYKPVIHSVTQCRLEVKIGISCSTYPTPSGMSTAAAVR